MADNRRDMEWEDPYALGPVGTQGVPPPARPQQEATLLPGDLTYGPPLEPERSTIGNVVPPEERERGMAPMGGATAPVQQKPRSGRDWGDVRTWQKMLLGMAAGGGNVGAERMLGRILDEEAMTGAVEPILKARQMWESGDRKGALATMDQAIPGLARNKVAQRDVMNFRMKMGDLFAADQAYTKFVGLVPKGGQPALETLRLAAEHGIDRETALKIAEAAKSPDAWIHYDPKSGALIKTTKQKGDVPEVVMVGSPAGMTDEQYKRLEPFTSQILQKQGWPKPGLPMPDPKSLHYLTEKGDPKAAAWAAAILEQAYRLSSPEAEEEAKVRQMERQEEKEQRMATFRETSIRGERPYSTTTGRILMAPSGIRLPDMDTKTAEALLKTGGARSLHVVDARLVGYARRGLELVGEMREVLPLILASSKKPFANIAAALKYGVSKGIVPDYVIGEWQALQGSSKVEAASAESRSLQGMATIMRLGIEGQVPGWMDTVPSAMGKLDVLETNLRNVINETMGQPSIRPSAVRKEREGPPQAPKVDIGGREILLPRAPTVPQGKGR